VQLVENHHVRRLSRGMRALAGLALAALVMAGCGSGRALSQVHHLAEAPCRVPARDTGKLVVTRGQGQPPFGFNHSAVRTAVMQSTGHCVVVTVTTVEHVAPVWMEPPGGGNLGVYWPTFHLVLGTSPEVWGLPDKTRVVPAREVWVDFAGPKTVRLAVRTTALRKALDGVAFDPSKDWRGMGQPNAEPGSSAEVPSTYLTAPAQRIKPSR